MLWLMNPDDPRCPIRMQQYRFQEELYKQQYGFRRPTSETKIHQFQG